MNANELQILLTAKSTIGPVLKQGSNEVEASAGHMSKAFGKLGDFAKTATLAVAGLGIGALAAGVSFMKSAAEEQVGMDRLRTAVENTGRAWDEHLNGVIEAGISMMEKSTAFSDGDMRDSLALLVSSTGDVQDAQDRMRIAMDLARGTGMDLVTASKLLGKVTDENIGVLGRYGITVKKGADATDLLDEVTRRFGGQAEAFAKTATGQWQIFNNQVDNLKEDIGAGLLPLFTEGAKLATGFIDALRGGGKLEAVSAWFQNAAKIIGELFGVITGSAPSMWGQFAEDKGAQVGIEKLVQFSGFPFVFGADTLRQTPATQVLATIALLVDVAEKKTKGGGENGRRS